MSSELDRNLQHTIRNQLNNISVNTELAKLQMRQQKPTDVIMGSLDKVSEACSKCTQALANRFDLKPINLSSAPRSVNMADKSNALIYFWSFLVGALGLLLIVNGMQTYQSLQVLSVNAMRSGATNRILQLAGNTYLAIQDAELNLRDYMSGEGDEGLEDYSQAVAKVQMLITELQLLSSELPLRQSRFEELLTVINTHNSALRDAAERDREAQLLENQPGTTDAEIILLDTQSERQEVVSLSRIMAASQESLTVLSELINTIENEEKNNIQGIMNESAQQRKQVSQAMLFANCLGFGFIIIIVILTIRSTRQQKEYALLLEGKIKERTNELELYALELSRSNRELQNFAFVASHDLQEPLRKIRAFGDRLSDRYSESLGDGKDYVVRMQNAASRMSKLIEDLLAFSRVSSRRKPFSQVDLNEVLSNVSDDLQFKIEENSLNL